MVCHRIDAVFSCRFTEGVSYRFPLNRGLSTSAVNDAIRDLPALNNGDAVCWRKYGQGTFPSAYALGLRPDTSTVLQPL